jgi:hypothetical protein
MTPVFPLIFRPIFRLIFRASAHELSELAALFHEIKTKPGSNVYFWRPNAFETAIHDST